MGKGISIELVERGKLFISRVAEASATLDFPMHYITEIAEGVRFDGSPMKVVADLSQYTNQHQSSIYLDQPLFKASEAVLNGRIMPQPAGSPIINVGDCSPEMLINLAQGLLEDRMVMIDPLKDILIERISAIFLNEATPRMLMADLVDYMTFVCKDNRHPRIYYASAEFFFRNLARKQILLFDVHDIGQHALQLRLWPEVFTLVTSIAHKAFAQRDTSVKAEFARSLLVFMWATVFEEAVLCKDGEFFSFGCLNWITPGDTPADSIKSVRVGASHPGYRQGYTLGRSDNIYALLLEQRSISGDRYTRPR